MSNQNQANTDKAPKIPKATLGNGARVKHAVAVLSGKGGVGKSFTTSYIAVELARRGYKVGILDADITGPSIPFVFDVKGPTYSYPDGMIDPIKSKGGIQIISSNLLLDNPNDPIVWRGAMISTLIEQFYTDVKWDVDFLLIDMAPGTGDVSLTVFQKFALSSAVLVTSPQGLVSLIVEKSARMAEMLSIPLVSLVENMAYVKCPDCGKRIDIYGKGDPEIGRIHGIPVFDEVPFDEKIAQAMDEGNIEDLHIDYINATVDAIINAAKDEE